MGDSSQVHAHRSRRQYMITTKRKNRVPPDWAPNLTGDEYKLMDVILFRNALPQYVFRMKTLIKETGLTEATIRKLMLKFVFLQEGQVERGTGIIFNYEGCMNVMPLCTRSTPVQSVQTSTLNVNEVQEEINVHPCTETPCNTTVFPVSEIQEVKENTVQPVQTVQRKTSVEGIDTENFDETFDKIWDAIEIPSPKVNPPTP